MWFRFRVGGMVAKAVAILHDAPLSPSGTATMSTVRSFRVRRGLALAVVLGACGQAVPGRGQDAPPGGTATATAPAEEADAHPDLKRLSRTEQVWIDPVRKEVVVGGSIALAEGPIEVFACPRGTKEHEAIVAVRASARLVHTALLAIGLEPGRPVSFQPDYVAADGPVVSLRMRWTDADGKVRESRAQDWIRNTATGRVLESDWVFAGSELWRDPQDGRQYYQADGGDMICVSNFPTAMLDLPIESTQGDDALLFEAFPDRVPPRGTPVEMILSAPRP